LHFKKMLDEEACMFVRRIGGLLVAGALGFAALPAPAQAAGGNNDYMSFPPGAAACPGISWMFKSNVAEPFGYVWFRDASGASRATGTLNKSTGALHLTLVSVGGKGPTGVFDGVRAADGSVTGTLKGEGCSNLTLGRPLSDLDDDGNQK
jgi:hypothetical protein